VLNLSNNNPPGLLEHLQKRSTWQCAKHKLANNFFYVSNYLWDYLVQCFIIPVRVNLRQCMSDTIVFSCHQCVHTCQDQLFIYSDLTWNSSHNCQSQCSYSKSLSYYEIFWTEKKVQNSLHRAFLNTLFVWYHAICKVVMTAVMRVWKKMPLPKTRLGSVKFKYVICFLVWYADTHRQLS